MNQIEGGEGDSDKNSPIANRTRKSHPKRELFTPSPRNTKRSKKTKPTSEGTLGQNAHTHADNHAIDDLDIEGVLNYIKERNDSRQANQERTAAGQALAGGNSGHHQFQPTVNFQAGTTASLLPRSNEEAECARAFVDVRGTFITQGTNNFAFHDVAWARFVSFPDVELRTHPVLEQRLVVLKEFHLQAMKAAAAYADRFLLQRQVVIIPEEVQPLLAPALAELASMYQVVIDPTHRWNLSEVYNMLTYTINHLAGWSIPTFKRHTQEVGSASAVSGVLRGRTKATGDDYRGIEPRERLAQPVLYVAQQVATDRHVGRQTQQSRGGRSTPQRDPAACRNCFKTSAHHASQCPEVCTWCPRSPSREIRETPSHARKECVNWKRQKS